MAKIIYVECNGTEHSIEVPEGWNLMDGAVRNDVPGILGECGGSCACATCHLFVDPAWFDRLPAPELMERDLLECTAADRQANSRLGCQVKVTAALDGMVVRLPDRQT
ncbi:MAG: 2Fe-2S iron-sulfur cluster binding domain-containing protein [Gammaproteobacteria bacterium]|nr:2Fe-2S iron-sulfur cluster binding domain-containing protein [Gammaproteobacteria bacterium]